MKGSSQNFSWICRDAALVTKCGGAERAGRFSDGELGEEELSGTDPTQDHYQEQKISSLGKKLYCNVERCIRKV